MGKSRMASRRLPSLPFLFSCRSCFQRRHDTVSTCSHMIPASVPGSVPLHCVSESVRVCLRLAGPADSESITYRPKDKTRVARRMPQWLGHTAAEPSGVWVPHIILHRH